MDDVFRSASKVLIEAIRDQAADEAVALTFDAGTSLEVIQAAMWNLMLVLSHALAEATDQDLNAVTHALQTTFDKPQPPSLRIVR